VVSRRDVGRCAADGKETRGVRTTILPSLAIATTCVAYAAAPAQAWSGLIEYGWSLRVHEDVDGATARANALAIPPSPLRAMWSQRLARSPEEANYDSLFGVQSSGECVTRQHGTPADNWQYMLHGADTLFQPARMAAMCRPMDVSILTRDSETLAGRDTDTTVDLARIPEPETLALLTLGVLLSRRR
jgi:hypothetical protein